MQRVNLVGPIAFAIAVAFGLGVTSAQAASIKEVFEKHNLIGAHAWDCSKPPGGNNWYFVNRAIDANTVQRDFMKTATERGWYAMLLQATEIGPNEIHIVGTRDGQPTEGIWRLERNRVMQWQASLAGRTVIANGRLTSNNFQIPWLNKCGAPG